MLYRLVPFALFLFGCLPAGPTSESAEQEISISTKTGPGGLLGSLTKSCHDDSDCKKGFCGWASIPKGIFYKKQPRVCKAYGQVGDTCGGRVLPEYRTVCDPALVCYGDGLVYDQPGTCVEQCKSDGDCDADSFCGWTNNGTDKICKPWAEEGEQCGGKVVLDAVAFCAPELECVGSDLNVDLPGTCQDTCSTLWDDSECNEGFCSPTDSNIGTQCRPFAQEGDECGGRVIPSRVGVCDDGLTCTWINALPYEDIPGECAVDCRSNADCGVDQYCHSEESVCIAFPTF